MKLKDIKNNFFVTGENGIYEIFDKGVNSSIYMNHKFLATIKYDSKKNIVTLIKDNGDDVVYDKNVDIQTFVMDVYNYANTLPFPSEFYYPNYGEHYKTLLKVDFYLKSIGFKKYGMKGDLYIIDSINPFREMKYILLEMGYDENKTSGVIIFHTSASSFIEDVFVDVDDAIAKINTIVKSILICSCALALNIESKLSKQEDKLNNTAMVLHDGIEKKYVMGMKEKVIKALKNAIKFLEEE